MNLSKDKSIVCIAHKCNRSKIQISTTSAFRQYPNCKLCNNKLDASETIPILRLDYPFCNVSDAACDLIVRPSRSDFLK